VLERGFAIVFDAAGNPVKRAASIHSREALTLRFRDGDAQAVATSSSPAKPKAKGAKSGGDQGSLF
jgi:exodeoxyribonuclease VII large subunit